MLRFRRTIGFLAPVAIVAAAAAASPQTTLAASQAIERPNQQRPAAGPILGRVIDATTGQPIRGAVVRTGGHDDRDAMALTDGDGRFVFAQVGAASIQFFATKGGYHDAEFGQLRPQSIPRMLRSRAGERRGDVVIRMWKQSVITGVVRDEAGEPLAERERRRETGGRSSPDDRG